MFAYEPLHQDFGARITGVDLTTPLSPAGLAELRQAIDHYPVPHFPGQDMSDDAELALTAQLGELEEGHVLFGRGSCALWANGRDAAPPNSFVQHPGRVSDREKTAAFAGPNCRRCSEAR